MLKKLTVLVLFALLIGSCRAGDEEMPRDDPPNETLPPLIGEDDTAPEEPDAVETSETVRREGDRLVIQLRTGGEVAFEDVQEGSYERDRVYRYQRLLPEIGYHMVEVRMHEGGGYLLIDEENGHQVFVDAPPVISPDRRRMVTTSMDFVAGYAPTAIRIYQITPEGIENEWAIETSEWGPSDARWLSSDRIEFIRNYPDEDGAVAQRERAVLRRIDNDWVLDGG